MPNIQQIQDQIIDEFNFFEDWSEKYQYLIDLGKNLPKFNDSDRIDSNLIKGCQSKVWLNSSFDNNIVISGHTPEEIISADVDFIDKIGFNSHLSQTRANGLLSMIKQIKIYALAYQAKQ